MRADIPYIPRELIRTSYRVSDQLCAIYLFIAIGLTHKGTSPLFSRRITFYSNKLFYIVTGLNRSSCFWVSNLPVLFLASTGFSSSVKRLLLLCTNERRWRHVNLRVIITDLLMVRGCVVSCETMFNWYQEQHFVSVMGKLKIRERGYGIGWKMVL